MAKKKAKQKINVQANEMTLNLANFNDLIDQNKNLSNQVHELEQEVRRLQKCIRILAGGGNV